MGDGIEIDLTDLYTLAADIASAPIEAAPLIRKAVEVTARNIKDDWRKNAAIAAGDGFSVRYPTTIFYDITGGVGIRADAIEAEIGPEVGRKASAGFLEEGGGKVQAPPLHAGRDALEANENDFRDGLEIALFDGTKKAVEK